MRFLRSFLVGLGLYVLAVAMWDVFAWIYLQLHWRHGLPSGWVVVRVVFKVHTKWDDLYAILPLILGHAIGFAAFAAGFYWTFRRTSAQHSN